jgi:hypothetical protein
MLLNSYLKKKKKKKKTSYCTSLFGIGITKGSLQQIDIAKNQHNYKTNIEEARTTM